MQNEKVATFYMAVANSELKSKLVFSFTSASTPSLVRSLGKQQTVLDTQKIVINAHLNSKKLYLKNYYYYESISLSKPNIYIPIGFN